MMTKSFYIIDGHYQIYRSFYAPFRELTSPTGEPTKATQVFCQMLFGLLRDRKPDYLAVVLDVGDESTFRRDLDETYKAHRDPAPDALIVQGDRIVSLIAALGVSTYSLAGFEADDLMATFTEKLKDQPIDIYLVSKDKDLEQLLSDRVNLFDVSKSEVIDPQALLEKKGFTPQQAVEIQTLTGDSTDNIPGVPGIGPKTAVKLIKQYGSAQAVLDHAEELTPKMAERVKAFAEKISLTRQLVTLRRDVPFDFNLSDCDVAPLNFAALREPFRDLGFNRLSDQLEQFIGSDSNHEETTVSAATISKIQRVNYQLVDSPKKFDAFLEQLQEQKIFAFDTETTGLNPVSADLVGLSFCWESGNAWYLPIRAFFGSVLPLTETMERLKPIFENQAVGKVGQNIKFDMLVMRQVGIKTNGVVFDTRIASFLLEPLANSHSLDAQAKRWFDHDMIPISDLIGKGKNQITLDQVETERVSDYASEDADFTWRLYEVWQPRMENNPVESLFRDTEVPLISVLTEMENHGIALDTKLLNRIGVQMGERLTQLTGEIYRATGHEFNVDSTKQLAVVLFDEQGLQVVKKTKTGRSTDHETLESLSSKTENPIPPLVLQYRELAKLKNTYVDKLPKMVSSRTGRLHASFDQTGAITGRLSSRDPNLQNIPVRSEMGRKIRQAFVACDTDHLILAADYSQIELRLLAHFCGDPALRKAFEEGQDIHRKVAAEINGIETDEVTSEQRNAAKAVNFGIVYGQSAFGLARSLSISMSDAKAFIDAYFDRFPGIRTFIDECIEKAKSKGFAETILGRRRPIEGLTSKNRQQISLGERLAVNTVVQGSAADLIKKAMIELHRVYLNGELQARMLVQVHDELVFDIHKGQVEQESQLIRNIMEHALELEIPVVVDIETGSNWAECK